MEISEGDTLVFRPHAGGKNAADLRRSAPHNTRAANDEGWKLQDMPIITRMANGRSPRFLMLALVALAMAGCSKCDMPVWRHDTAPQSCHDEAPPQ
jgi:hypothetical protein